MDKKLSGVEAIWVGENKICRNSFKAVVMAAVVLLFPLSFGFSQSTDYVVNHDNETSTVVENTSENASNGNEKNVDKVNDSKSAEQDILLSSSATKSASGNAKKGGAMSTFLVFLKMILVLAIVIAIIWIIFKLLQKSTGNSSVSDDKFLRKVASITVSPGKTVQIVTLIDRAFLIGVADNSINLISEIDDKELISAMNLYADKNSTTTKPKNFSDILDIFMPKKKKSGEASGFGNNGKKNAFEDGAAQQILDTLKKQSERMNKE